MISSYHTLAFVTSILKSKLEGLEIRSIFTQDPDELVAQFGTSGEHVVFSCDRNSNSFYLHPHYARAKRNTVDLMGEAVGKVVREIALHPSDRIVSLRLDHGLCIRAQFFGPKANVLLVNADETIVDAFKNPRALRGLRYEVPAVRHHEDPSRLLAVLQQTPELGVATALKAAFSSWGPILVKEALERARVPASSECGQLESEQIQTLRHCIEDIFSDLKNPQPRVYFSDHDVDKPPVEFAIVPLQQLSGVRERLFNDVNEAIRFFITRRKAGKATSARQSDIAQKLRALLTKVERSIEAAELDLSTSKRGDEYERFGRLLMNGLTAVKKGMKNFETSDELGSVTIPLSPELSPAQNAQRYFEKAKKSRSARDQAVRRLHDMRKRASLLERLLSVLPSGISQDELKQFETDHQSDLEELGLGEKQREREQLPFRVYTVDGGFEVWAGKNSKSNELLTLKYAKPNDLWFHARGAGGSHVVLKVNTASGEPSKKARSQAAAIAAFHSKMKNSKLVPVAMTRRKYVRKSKGSPPGTVTIEREEVILVEPKLPRQ